MTRKSADPSETGINWESDEVAEHWSRNQSRRDEHIGPATELMPWPACRAVTVCSM